MKRCLLIALAMLPLSVTRAQIAVDSAVVEPEEGLWPVFEETEETFTEPEMEEVEFPPGLMNHPYIRYQSNINEADKAEAYPWISADGLRLYFIKENKVYHSIRRSRYEDFRLPLELILNEESVVSCWLSNDELRLYITGGTTGDISEFSRSDRSQPFHFVRPLNLDGQIEGFTSSISFSPDGKTALLYNSPSEGPNSLLILDAYPDGRLQLRKRFVPAEFEVGTGQLSKDGKQVYFSLEMAENHTILYKASLQSLEMDNPGLTMILELKGLRIGKPSLTYDETYMVFNANATDSWQENEIMVVDLNNLSYITKDTGLYDFGPVPVEVGGQRAMDVQPDLTPEKLQIGATPELSGPGAEDFELGIGQVYPNPTKQMVYIEFKVPVNAEVAQIIVHDSRGLEIYRKKISPSSREYAIDLNELGLAEGYYLIFLHTELGSCTASQVFYQP